MYYTIITIRNPQNSIGNYLGNYIKLEQLAQLLLGVLRVMMRQRLSMLPEMQGPSNSCSPTICISPIKTKLPAKGNFMNLESEDAACCETPAKTWHHCLSSQPGNSDTQHHPAPQQPLIFGSSPIASKYPESP